VKAEIVALCKEEMAKAIESFRSELSRVRSGRASLALLDGVRIDYYGSQTPLSQVANLATPEPMLITVQPWDKSNLALVEKAIVAADLGLNPQNDGNIIRIVIPALNAERRKEIVKKVKKIGDHSKTGIRSHRRDANEQLKDLQKKGKLTEDELRKGHDQVQVLTDDFIANIEDTITTKEQEILQV